MPVRKRSRNLRRWLRGGGADAVFVPLTAISVENPMDNGAVGNGVANDLAALEASVDGLPAGGGIVYFPPGNTFRKNNLWVVDKDNVILWRPATYSPGREATVFADDTDDGSKQAIQWDNRAGCGVFGLKITSDASSRGAPFEDNALSFLNSDDIEVCGVEIDNAKATGITCSNTTRSWIEHNYIHHTWADHIMRAYGQDSLSYVWSNFMVNTAGRGDDCISIVTSPSSTDPKIRDCESWLNIGIGGGGRGISVIGGGPNVSIHDNWMLDKEAAGILIASEEGFDSATVNGVAYSGNKVLDCCTVVTSHAGILVSGGYAAVADLTNIVGTGNWSVDSGAQPYRSEGEIGANVTSTGLQTTQGSLPLPIPVAGDATHGDTTVLRTRNVTFVAAGSQPGLYRIHVRGAPGSFEQRFEYVFKGTPANVSAVVATRVAAGDYLSAQQTVAGTAYALLLTKAPFAIGGTVSAVTFSELRSGDNDGSLSWLWDIIDSGDY